LSGVVLDLADALARHVERTTDLLQRVRAGAGEAEAHLDDLALALGKRLERAAHVLTPQVLGRHLERRLGRLVLDEVSELGLLFLADRLLERDRLLGHPQDVADLAHRRLQLGGDLLGRRLAPSSWTSWRSTWTTLLSFSTMWTGMRIVRPLSAIARVTAWRIHQVAYVENL
jgi:hypothetical protein